MDKLRVMLVFGTRPEAIKMAPVVKELQKYPELIEATVVVTAQHREMLDQVLRWFDISVDFDLKIMEVGQTLFQITIRSLGGLDDILRQCKPDVVLVQGDTTTTFTAALSAFYHRITVGHVEAGLRTENKYSPFPEEINRRLTSHLADLHFAPTRTSKENLMAEGIREENIYITGNTVIDALLAVANSPFQFEEFPVAELSKDERKIITVEAHRRENLGEPLGRICWALIDLLDRFEDILIVWPVHRNPEVREVVFALLGGRERIYLLEPLDYVPFVHLMKRSYLILSDSGGIQEEAPSLGKPVLVLRDTTERPEVIKAGVAKLVGTDRDEIVSRASELLENETEYKKMARFVNPYGDGRASHRIVEALLYHFGISRRRPKEFVG